VLFNLQKQEVIIIADPDDSSLARIKAELQSKDLYTLKFAVNDTEMYEIIREYYESPKEIGLIIVSDDLPGLQLENLYKFFSHADHGIFIPLIVLKNDSFSTCNEWKPDGQHLVLHLAKNYSSIELQMAVNFFICLKNEKYLRHQQQERLLTELSERKLVDAKLKYMVGHDELTGLLNRSSLEQHIRLTLNRNSNNKFSQDSVLLFIDLDRFSLINELESFDVGDRLLIEIISLIRNVLNNVGLFARIDSDKFGLYLENCSVSQAETWSEKIRKSLDDFRFVIGTIAYSITASIGLSSLNSAKSLPHPHELIFQAHQACCMAKTNGRNMVWKYNNDDTIIRERHRDIYWVPIIRDAFLNKRFFLVFQPIVNLTTGSVSHYEVLIRLRSEEGLVIGPSEFIPAAERMGLIHCIDLWVVENTIDYLAALPAELSHISLAINLSSVAFQDESLLPMIKQKLEMTFVRAERIIFEITETAAVNNFKQTRSMIHQIRALGCRFALDDFGAGFCSFNYLKSFPVDHVKIDGQFIQNLTNDETDQMLVLSMHQIAKKMGKRTIAEFVECPQTVKLLRDIGVNYGQGYIFGKPSEQFLKQDTFQINHILHTADLHTIES